MFKQSLLVVSVAALVTACGGDSNKKSSNNNPFTMALTTSGDNAADYLVTQDDILTETVSAQGAGLEHSGWQYYYPAGKTIFVIGSNTEGSAYQLENKALKEVNSFNYEHGTVGTMGKTGDTLLLSNASWSSHDPLKLSTFDGITGKAGPTVNYTIYNDGTGTPGEGSVPWPTSLIVRGDKLFVSYLKFNDTPTYTAVDENKASVAIFDYPVTEGAAPTKIITDDRIPPLGVHGRTAGLVKTDNGDLYGWGNGEISAGFTTASTKPSGIVKIAKDAEAFDSEYFFNVEEATNGGKIFWLDHIGGEKAIARVIMPTTATLDHDEDSETPEVPANQVSWEDFSITNGLYRQKLVILDLAAKTVTDVKGVPLHYKRVTPSIQVIGGKVYMAILTDGSTDVYEINVNKAEGKKGAAIEGKTIRAFFKL